MSEQKTNYMQELGGWIDANVIRPLLDPHLAAYPSELEAFKPEIAKVKKALREKVLQSYRNGRKAGARPARKEPRQ